MMAQLSRISCRGWSILTLTTALCLGCYHAQGQTNAEFRGLWAEAWSPDLWTASGINTLLSDLRKGNMNAVIPQMRRRGDALYVSHYEPKCADISASFDPLADLISKAHNTNSGARIDVHAWLVTYHIWKGTNPPPQATHPLNLHPDWLLKDINGNTLIGNEYTFDPGHPEVQKHTFNVCMDLITNYDLDGINFDYIRYSSTSEGYNDVTVARFNRLFNRTGLPSTGDPAWKQFRRDQVTALLRKVYLNAIALKPWIKVSCDTITWAPGPTSDATWYSSAAAWNSVLQDWRGWMQEGIMDMNVPMNYFRQPANGIDYTNWSNFAKDRKFDRHLVNGPGIYLNSVSDAIAQMRLSRYPSPGGNTAEGVCGYDYQVTNKDKVSRATFLSALTTASSYDPISPPMFAQPVPVPVMPWKANPTKGHIKGFVFGGSLTNPLDGAIVRLSGPVNRVQTNDATGFFGFVDLLPGSYTLSASNTGYFISSASVTVSAGVVSTRDLTLTVNGAPVILADPRDQAVIVGSNALFTVNATGTGTLQYQWRLYSTNLPGRTDATLNLTGVATDQAGPYQVVVNNNNGAVTSTVANLVVLPPPPASRIMPLWSLAPGTRPYLTVSSLPNERGMAVNPVSHRVLLASRAGPHIYVLDAEMGADLHELNLAGVSGGTYTLLMLGAADDGAVYAGNLTTTAGTLSYKLYRWANDNAATVPTTIFDGDPVPGVNQRWGDTMDVRGAGTTTQILLGSRSGTNAVIFTTVNGTTFTPRTISVAGISGGSFGLGIAFGSGNTFWGKNNGGPLRQFGFDLVTGAGTVLRTIDSSVVPNAVAPIGVSPTLEMLGGINITSPNHLRVYDLPASPGNLSLIATNLFPTDNDNTGAGTGSVKFFGDRVYALDSNNGLLAVQIARPPALNAQPQPLTIKAGQMVRFEVSASSIVPLAYQWRLNGNGIPGATSNVLVWTPALTNHSGVYSVVVTNVAGATTSSNALLTVLPPAVPQILHVGQITDGPMEVSGTGDPGTYAVDVSDDLVHWQEIVTVVSTNGVFQWWDPDADLARRFYRVRWSP